MFMATIQGTVTARRNPERRRTLLPLHLPLFERHARRISTAKAPVKKETPKTAAADTTLHMALSAATAAKDHGEGLGKEMAEL